MHVNKHFYAAKFIAGLAMFLLSGVVGGTASAASYTASLSTSGDVNITIDTPGSANVATDNVTVESTCPTGYTLYISGPADNTLYRGGDSSSSQVINATAGTMSAPAVINGNNLGTWGFSLTSSDATGTFAALPNTETPIHTKSSAAATGGDTIPVYFGASATSNQAAGTYTMADNDAVTFILLNDINCMSYTVKYDGNSADAGQTMSVQHEDVAINDTLSLYASNFKKAGYGFAGWSTERLDPDATDAASQLKAAVTAGKVYGPNQAITADNNFVANADSTDTITLYAVWVKPIGTATFQNWQGCGALNVGDIIALTDARDNQTYAVAKLADGQCWMIENLRLDNTATIDSANTNNPKSGFSLAASSTGWCTAGNATCQNESKVNTDNTANAAADMTASNQNIYSYGNYYNYYSATAGYGTRELTANNVETDGDICPAGWALPVGGDTNSTKTRDFYNLIKIITGEEPNTANGTRPYYTGEQYVRVFTAFPNNFVFSGQISGNIGARGSDGNYWSGTNGQAGNAYRLALSATQAQVNSWNNKYNGFPVRCIAQPPVETYTIEFDANGGTGDMSPQIIERDRATNLTTNTFTRTNYTFAGWNTATDGSGTSYTDGQSVTNLAAAYGSITLYAQWEEACGANNICYNSNGANSLTTMGRQTISSSATSVNLWASNFQHTGGDYGFAGWNTKADGTGTNYGPNETITDANVIAGIKANGLKLYAKWVPSAGNIQSWNGCSAMSIGDVTALKDQRDNNTYAVAKLADGNCWMIENLRLDNQYTTGNANKALAQGYNSSFIGLANPETANFSNSTTANSLYSTDGSTAAPAITGSSQGYRFPRYNNQNTASPATQMSAWNDSANTYSVGNYYTWAAAIADTSYYPSGDHNTTSICPTGWRIPTGDTTGEYKALNDALGGDTGATGSNALRSYPNNFIYSGYFYTSSVYRRGSEGGYWSSTASNNYYSYRLNLNSSGVSPGAAGGYQYYGRSIRCLSGS